MPYPAISALPAVPSRNAPSTFSALMDAFLAAFPQFRSELNALAAYLDTLALATGPGLFLPGSAAAPGISWAADPNTGLFRPAADQIGFATNGVQRALLTTAALQLDLPMTGTAVQSSAVDATAGRLLKINSTAGAFGIGATRPPAILNAEDLNTYLGGPSGIYRWDDAPINAPAGYCALVNIGGFDMAAAQYVQTRSGVARAWIRGNASSSILSPGAWAELYSTANLLGTVSQSGGIPTGKVIERGSFASGDYIRLADGTQICWRVRTFTALAADTTVSETWTFPAQFFATPFCWSEHPASANPHLAWSSALPASATTATISARHSLGVASDRAVYFYALGRWF